MKLPLNSPDKFADAFIDAYLAQGFQSLSKRDIDLLVFLLLERDGVLSRETSNFEVGRQLCLTPGKVRALRRDAYARWRALLGDDDTTSQLKRVLCEILTKERIDAGARYASTVNNADGYFAIHVAHADDRQTLEHALLQAHEYTKHERNPEVMVVSFGSMLMLARKYNFVSDPEGVYKKLKRLAARKSTLNEVLTADMSELGWEDVRAAFNDVGARVVATSIEGINPINLLRVPFPFISNT